MGNRLDQERQAKLEPIRMTHAINEITKMGYTVKIKKTTEIQFEFNGKTISYFPYSGWSTGSTIKDGRGLKNLLKQIK